MRKISVAACFFFWCVGIFLLGSMAERSEASREAGAVPGQVKVLKNSDVLAAVKARMPDAAIVATFDRADCEFDISAVGLLDLTKNGVSTTVINGMVEAMRKKRAGESVTSIGASAAEEAVPAEKSAEIVRSEMSQDPRIKALPAGQREGVLAETAQAVRYCGGNNTLSNFFWCECFAKKFTATRLQFPDTHDYPMTNLIAKVNYLECAAPPKIERYGRDREIKLDEFETKKHPSVTQEMVQQIAECAGKELVNRFDSTPTDVITAIDGMFANVSLRCKQKIEGGITTRNGVQPGMSYYASGAAASSATGSVGGSSRGASGGSSAGAAGVREFGYCYGEVKDVHEATYYFSAIFSAPPGNEAREAFRDWIAQRNGGQRTGLCFFSRLQEDAESGKEHMKQNCQKQLDMDKRGRPTLNTAIVESGWTYGQ